MGVFRVNATREGRLVGAAEGGDWRAGLPEALAGLAADAPICILIHGFRFTWRPEIGGGVHCPHLRLYRSRPVAPTRRRRPGFAAWPWSLGFAAETPRAGLAIALGWEARAAREEGRALGLGNAFARVYRRTPAAGRALAHLIDAVAGLRPGAAVDLFGHSLGARVALQAARARPDLPLGRMIFLGPADYAAEARAALAALERAGSGAEIYSVLSRANDAYDGLFQLFAPAPESPGDRPLGAAGLGVAERRWLDLQLDHAALGTWLAARGLRLAGPERRLSHWHFYDDPGAMAFYAAILRQRAPYAIERLRAAGLPGAIEPRWSRLAPALAAHRLRPAPRKDAALTGI